MSFPGFSYGNRMILGWRELFQEIRDGTPLRMPSYSVVVPFPGRARQFLLGFERTSCPFSKEIETHSQQWKSYKSIWWASTPDFWPYDRGDSFSGF